MSNLTNFYASPEFVFLLKMIGSVVAGSVIGLERYQNGHPAGMRTFAIISLTSTFLTASLTEGMYGNLMGQGDMGASRIIQGILQGIGFIGAGVIVREGFSIKGLTSAASIWAVAGIGILIGTAEYFLAISGTIFTILILVTFRQIDKLTSRRSFAVIEAKFVKGAVPEEEQIFERFTSYGFNVSSIAFKGAKSGAMQIKVHVWASKNAAKARSRLAMEFLSDPSIADFSVEPVRE
ncbi:MAG: MgtC/SapB family protein [Sterolibacterium sp.]